MARRPANSRPAKPMASPHQKPRERRPEVSPRQADGSRHGLGLADPEDCEVPEGTAESYVTHPML